MNTRDPRRALEALASEHGLAILRFLRGRGWTLASHVAESLQIHTTTASKHLAAFHEAGFLDRQAHAARRPTFAYRLPTPLIRIEFDLAAAADPNQAAEAAEAFLDSLLAAVQRVGGPRISEELVRGLLGGTDDWRRALRVRFGGTDARTTLDALIEDSRQTCARLVGATTAERLVRHALEDGFEGRRSLLPEAPA